MYSNLLECLFASRLHAWNFFVLKILLSYSLPVTYPSLESCLNNWVKILARSCNGFSVFPEFAMKKLWSAPWQTKLFRWENSYCKSWKWGRLSLDAEEGKNFRTHAIFVIIYISINFHSKNYTMLIVYYKS